MEYVALSRIKTLKELAILNLDIKRFLKTNLPLKILYYNLVLIIKNKFNWLLIYLNQSY
jgi:hypothetical protein